SQPRRLTESAWRSAFGHSVRSCAASQGAEVHPANGHRVGYLTLRKGHVEGSRCLGTSAVPGSPFLFFERRRLVQLAAQTRLPAVSDAQQDRILGAPCLVG